MFSCLALEKITYTLRDEQELFDIIWDYSLIFK